MIEGRLLVAYHGCDITTRDDLVTGKLTHLDHSKNPYDWLGPGAYFFEGDAERALMFARASHDNPAKMYTARAIGTPAVVGAILRVQRWLDMTTQEGINEFTLAYPALLDGLKKTGSPVPKNAAASEDDIDVILRKLDNAVFTFHSRYPRQPKSSGVSSPAHCLFAEAGGILGGRGKARASRDEPKTEEALNRHEPIVTFRKKRGEVAKTHSQKVGIGPQFKSRAR